MTQPNLALVDQPGYTASQIALIKRTVAKDATDDELEMYFHHCRRLGVHPLDKFLYFTKRKGKYTPITSIDLFRTRAASTNEHAGTDDAVYATEEGTKYPQSATVTVYRLKGGVRCPFTATARWFEYKPQQDDFMWVKMPYTMLAKCAEALALRKAFPQELAGFYTKDEMAQAGPEDEGRRGVADLSETETVQRANILDETAGKLKEIEAHSDDPEDLDELLATFNALNNRHDDVERLAAPRLWSRMTKIAKAKGWMFDRQSERFVVVPAAKEAVA